MRFGAAGPGRTDEQFERKVERLLENDTLESVEDRNRDREQSTEFE